MCLFLQFVCSRGNAKANAYYEKKFTGRRPSPNDPFALQQFIVNKYYHKLWTANSTGEKKPVPVPKPRPAQNNVAAAPAAASDPFGVAPAKGGAFGGVAASTAFPAPSSSDPFAAPAGGRGGVEG